MGLECDLYVDEAKLAASNAEQAFMIRQIFEKFSYELAAPAEAGATLKAERVAPRSATCQPFDAGRADDNEKRPRLGGRAAGSMESHRTARAAASAVDAVAGWRASD